MIHRQMVFSSVVPQSEIMRIISCVLLSQHIQRKQVDNTIKILNHIMSIYKLLTNWIQRVPVTDTGPQQTYFLTCE